MMIDTLMALWNLGMRGKLAQGLLLSFLIAATSYLFLMTIGLPSLSHWSIYSFKAEEKNGSGLSALETPTLIAPTASPPAPTPKPTVQAVQACTGCSLPTGSRIRMPKKGAKWSPPRVSPQPTASSQNALPTATSEPPRRILPTPTPGPRAVPTPKSHSK
ncbi:hypothetical protein [Tengunoibacter tsumagoiensis]|uniref:Uncharacterized protein n=1 Tax=Tengunoibacter tsumagoiensis TaxID=2014871 RepID=A0A402A4J2_9CHLR|nr:hypothetical protein [Tengunoibacter tsumagoiensis]GCE14030.1 hypothetical protein KTT_38890 [Tengunoibacter tsumagoiensis]